MDKKANIKIINTVDADDRKYEMMNDGINPQAFTVMQTIGLNLFSIQRFRDAGYDDLRKRIWILARTGSLSYFPHLHNHHLEQNEYFLKRYDEPFDSTYEILLFNRPIGTVLSHVLLPDLESATKKTMVRLQNGTPNKLEAEFLANLEKEIEES